MSFNGTGNLVTAPFNGAPARMGGSGLLQGLTHYWTLDEASGTRNDSIGAAHLTDNNTVGSVAGKNGNAASFVTTSSQSLTSASGEHIDLTVGWTVAFWWFLPDTGRQQALFTYSVDATHRLHVDQAAAGTKLRVYDGAGSSILTNNVTPTAGAWHLVVVWYDPTIGTNGSYRLAVNNDATIASGTGALGGAPAHENRSVRLGVYNDATRYMTGYIDEVYSWPRVLTDNERTTLYNSGTGKFFPFS